MNPEKGDKVSAAQKLLSLNSGVRLHPLLHENLLVYLDHHRARVMLCSTAVCTSGQ